VVGYRTTDVAAEGERYDVVLDAVGTYGVERMHGALVPGGAVLTVATDLRGLLGAGRLARRYGIRVVTGPGPWRADDLAHVTRLADAGALRPVIERVLPFENIVEAHRIVDGGRKGGAVVLTITDSVDWS
jgi:NADPH:quinone reductase-like Zn-dependent oxidoreductase